MKKIFMIFALVAIGFGANAQAVKVLSNGNVGIGTNSPNPAYKLTVSGGIGASQISVYKNVPSIGCDFINDNLTYDQKTLGHYSLGWYNDSWEPNGQTLWMNAWGGMKFFTYGAVRMTIHKNGNVGIGKIPASNRKLDISGNVYANDILLTSDERLKTNDFN